MEIKRAFKYNPAFLSDDELLDSFCAREGEFEILMRCIKENTGEVNQHLLLIGIRGSGKTMLLRRVVAEIKRNGELSSKWYPVMFSEENYEILSLDDFWMQSLYYIDSARSGYDELKNRGSRDPYSEDIGLSKLLNFADREGKRILLVCENLQDMLSVIPENDAWKLRNVLQTDHRIMLLGSAVTRFDQIENYDQPFYEFFKTLTLERLSASDCKNLWIKITGSDKNLKENRARALQILTGGLPRLLAVIALFGAHLSFKELIRDFERLIDDHTDYFKGQMEVLPAKERKVFATLARLWNPSASSEVAREARMEHTETSSLINRLVNRGAIEEFTPSTGKKRAKLFQLSERLFNIYYLTRIGGKYSLWVKPMIEFLAQAYEKHGKKHRETQINTHNKTDARRHLEDEKNYDKTIECLTPELSYPNHILNDVQRINNLCIDIAAVSRDRAESLIEIIENSPSRDALSPLTAGIKNYLGIEFLAPLEIREIADDIKKWIEERIIMKMG